MRAISKVLAWATGAIALTLAACATPPEMEAGATLAEGENQICRRMTATGSNMPQRVCATAEEWAAREQAGRQSYEELRSDARAANASSFP